MIQVHASNNYNAKHELGDLIPRLAIDEKTNNILGVKTGLAAPLTVPEPNFSASHINGDTYRVGCVEKGVSYVFETDMFDVRPVNEGASYIFSLSR